MMNKIIDSTFTPMADGMDVVFLDDGRKTMAILEDSEGRPLALGEAKCGAKDPYSTVIGQTLSLGRALAKLGENYIDLAAALDVANTLERVQ